MEHLVGLPEGADLGKAVNDAMGQLSARTPTSNGVLPRAYAGLPNAVLVELLRLLGRLPDSIEGDGFGLVHEHFLGQFAFAEGQKGGEFFTPTSIVKLIVEIIEPYHGKVYDPACGSGGMFVQSVHFVERHRKDPGSELSIYGQEKAKETVRLAKMNLAVHGLGGVLGLLGREIGGEHRRSTGQPALPPQGEQLPVGLVEPEDLDLDRALRLRLRLLGYRTAARRGRGQGDECRDGDQRAPHPA